MTNEKKSDEEIIESLAKMYKGKMRNASIAFGVFGVLSAVIMYLLHFHLPVYIFVFLVNVEVICICVSLLELFDLGRFSEISYFAPKLCKIEGKCQKLSTDLDEYVAMSRDEYWHLSEVYISLAFFINARSPGLLAEFAAWRKNQSQSSAEGKN